MSETLPESALRPSTRRRDPEEKRRRLLDAGEVLFCEQDYEATTTLQIARKAGVSEGILFHQFGTKRALLVEILKRFARAAAEATMPGDESAVTEESVVRGAFDFSDRHPQIYTMLARSGAAFSEQELRLQNEIIVTAIKNKLSHGMALGKIRQGDPEIMAQLQFAIVDAAYRAWRHSGEPNRREEYIAEAVRCMQAMLAPDKVP